MKSLEHIIREIREGVGSDAVTKFAAAAHDEWRKGFDPDGSGKERIKQNSDGTSGNINVPFNQLHPDWQKENLEAGKAAMVAIRKNPNNMEGAAEHVHNEWMKRNPKADWNASQHVPYSDLPEPEKEKDRVHVRKMASILGKPISEQTVCLEHSIRKVMTKRYESSFGAKDSKPVEEGIGIIGTDKYQGNEFKSIRTATPHIKPPAGEGSHSQAPENASRQRSIAKEKAGINRVEEENVDEAAVLGIPTAGAALAAGIGAYGAYKAGKSLPDIWAAGKKGAASLSNKIDKVVNPSQEDLERAQKAIQSKSVAAPAIDKPIEVQAEPEKKKKEEPTKVAEPSAKPAAEAPPKATEKPAEVATPAKVEAPPKTAAPAVPATPAATTPASAPAATTPAASTPAVANPSAVTPAKLAAVTAATAAATASPEGKKFSYSGKSSGSHDSATDVLHRIAVKTQTHLAKKHRMHEDTKSRETIENMPRKGERKSIEYVGRKDADPKSTKEKTSRLAIIKNVIDEAKKEIAAKKQTSFEDGRTKVYDYGKDVVIISPDQRRVDLDVEGDNKLPTK